jgi:hypothetical protein
MTGAGEVLEKPVSGQRVVFRKTAAELLEVEAVYTKPTPSRAQGLGETLKRAPIPSGGAFPSSSARPIRAVGFAPEVS